MSGRCETGDGAKFGEDSRAKSFFAWCKTVGDCDGDTMLSEADSSDGASRLSCMFGDNSR